MSSSLLKTSAAAKEDKKMSDKIDAKESSSEDEMGYQHTLMYGRYSKKLGEFAREEAAARKHQQPKEVG
jgi:hypothetical protein